MSWGTYYTYDGYILRVGKNELKEKYEDLKDDNDTLWNEILQRIAMTPPQSIKDCEDNDMDYVDYMSNHIKYLRQQIEENNFLMARIDDCLETLQEHPDKVSEG